MENHAKNNNGAVKGVNTVKADKTPQFVAGNPVNKDSVKPDAEKGKETEQAEAPQVQEQPQAGVKAEPAKPVRNLEQTIKYLEELHGLKTIRDKYMATIKNLDEFAIDLKKDADETDGNYYQGCQLTIEDDERRKFTTKNPLIIWTVAQQIVSICESKLAEVEARLVITA